MKIFIFINVVGFLMLVSSCTKERASTEDIKVVEIDVNERRDYNFSTFFDTCFIVPLETTDIGLIGDITDVILKEENIFILDSRKSKSVFIYDWKGRLRNILNNIGEGPGQYLYPLSITVSESDSILHLLDSRSHARNRYKFNGEFIDRAKLDPSSMYTDMIQNNGFIYTTGGDNINEDKYVNVFDSNFNILRKINTSIRNDIWIQQGRKKNYFYETFNGEGVIYKGFLTNSIFEIDKDSISHIIQFNFSTNSFEFDPSKPVSMQELYERIRRSNSYIVGNRILDSHKYMFIDVIKGEYISTVLYNKDTEEANLVDRLINDMDGMTVSITGIMTDSDAANYLIVILFPIQFKEAIGNRKLSNHYDLVLNSIELDNADNPVLFIYRFKK